MTIPRSLGSYFGLLCSAAALFGCSAKDVTPSADVGGMASGGSGGKATGGSSGNATSGGTSGGSTSGEAGTKSDAGSPTGSDQVVGTFQVQIAVDQDDQSTGLTKIVGQVGDGPVPLNVLWTVAKEEGDCRLETPKVPFCEAGCGADVCVADGVCQAYPTNHSVGAVTLVGPTLVAGGATVMLKEIAKAYQPPAGTNFAYPPFGADDMISLHADGGDYAAFDLAAPGVDPIQISTTDFELDVDKAFDLAWDPAKDPKASRVYIKVDISHHGGIRGMIECETDDTGSLSITAPMMTELIGLGVAGYPSVVLIRRAYDSAAIAPGRVQLEVSSKAERIITVKGVDSCTVDMDCPEGKTCRTSDSTCQ